MAISGPGADDLMPVGRLDVDSDAPPANKL
jgi:hypothetical protein